jgi:hypothetical protein
VRCINENRGGGDMGLVFPMSGVRDHVESGKAIIRFYSVTAEYGELSNFAPTSEHYFREVSDAVSIAVPAIPDILQSWRSPMAS